MEPQLESHQCQGFSVGKQVLKIIYPYGCLQLPEYIQHHASVVGNYVDLPVNLPKKKPSVGPVQDNSLYTFPVNQSKDLHKLQEAYQKEGSLVLSF